MTLIAFAVFLVLAGLGICFLSAQAGRFANLFWWVGVVVAGVGLVLLLAPVIVWLDREVRSVLGV